MNSRFSDFKLTLKIEFNDHIYSGTYKLHKIILYEESPEFFKLFFNENWHDDGTEECSSINCGEITLPKLVDNYFVLEEDESEGEGVYGSLIDLNNNITNSKKSSSNPNPSKTTKRSRSRSHSNSFKLNKPKIDNMLDNVFNFIYNRRRLEENKKRDAWLEVDMNLGRVGV